MSLVSVRRNEKSSVHSCASKCLFERGERGAEGNTGERTSAGREVIIWCRWQMPESTFLGNCYVSVYFGRGVPLLGFPYGSFFVSLAFSLTCCLPGGSSHTSRPSYSLGFDLETANTCVTLPSTISSSGSGPAEHRGYGCLSFDVTDEGREVLKESSSTLTWL